MRLVGIGGFVVKKSNKVTSELLMNNKANELLFCNLNESREENKLM